MTTREQIKAALDALDKLFTDKNPYFNVAHHLQARYLGSHRETICALLSGDIAALRAACPDGFAVVPRVANTEQRIAGVQADFLRTGNETCAHIYTEMVEAEHPAEKGN